MSITKRREALNTLAPEDPFSSSMLKDSLYMERPCAPREGSSPSIENKKRKLSMDTHNPRNPNTGDVIGCSDGDIGIVLRVYPGASSGRLMVEVLWNSGKILTDPWKSQDYCTEDDMFHIMSRA